jgi:hypothetical protein
MRPRGSTADPVRIQCGFTPGHTLGPIRSCFSKMIQSAPGFDEIRADWVWTGLIRVYVRSSAYEICISWKNSVYCPYTRLIYL